MGLQVAYPRKQEASYSPTAALGSREIGRLGDWEGRTYNLPSWDGVEWGTFRPTEPDILFLVSPPSQQAETLKKRLPWQLAFLLE